MPQELSGSLLLKSMRSQASITDLLQAVNSGSESARDELIGVVYDELRRLANGYLRGERSDHTLQPTALVHEAYLRLIGQDAVRWRNRDHFIAVAATMMRRVLVDHARGHNRDKRGGGAIKLSLADADHFTRSEEVDFVALDIVLEKLAKDYPQESQIVELRFFGGLSISETARVLKISESTVERDWRFARAWLLREMNGE
jgi:RNA polymerase sigma factor (TIGR02999 family)